MVKKEVFGVRNPDFDFFIEIHLKDDHECF